MTRTPMSARKAAVVVLAAAAMFPVALALYVMCTNWVSVPHWDAWQTPGQQIAAWCRGTLTFSDLFSQHNEHRPFFPRLGYVTMAVAFGWDVRREMAAGFLLLCVASAGLYLLLRQSGVSRAISLAALALMNLLLFTPRQYENLLSGTEGASFLPTVALLCALAMNQSRSSFALKTTANAALALVGTYTFGNGMLLWPLAFPLSSSDDETRARRLLWRALYIATGAAAIMAYFISYEHPPLAPAPAHLINDAGGMLNFVARWLGAFFLTPAPGLIGGITLTAFAAVALITVRTATWRAYLPWLFLGAYAAASGALAARSRLGFGLEMAGDARYSAFAVFFHIALVGLFATMLGRARQRAAAARAVQLAAGLYATAVVGLSVHAYFAERPSVAKFRATRERVREIVQRSPANADNPELKLLSPYPETAETIRTLSACGLLRPRREVPDTP